MAENHAQLDPNTLPPFLSTAQVADLLGVSPGTLRQWRHHRTGPAYIRLNGGPCRYERSVLLAYLAARTVGVEPVTAEPGYGDDAALQDHQSSRVAPNPPSGGRSGGGR